MRALCARLNGVLNGVRVRFSNQLKYLVAVINALLKDDNDILRQVKSLCCLAKS